MESFSKAVDRIITSLTTVGFVALMLMMLVVVANIVLRSLSGIGFGKPIVGTYEGVQLLITVAVAFALSYTAIKDSHVNMDMVILRLSRRSQSILTVINSILSLGIWALIAWYSFVYAGEQATAGESTSIMEWPIYPFRFIFALGAIILCLVMVLAIFKAVKELRRK
jgi:TRAP-type C4-dicarboxylate transport system permease small subunit